MNVFFEDVVVFDEMFEKFEGDWEIIFLEYEKVCKIDIDVIVDLVVDNFYEMKEYMVNLLF